MEVSARSGDSLWYVSKLFAVPFELVIDSNRHLHPHQLKAKDPIRIPGFRKVPYMLQKGDTIAKIAASKRLAIDAIMILNTHLHPAFLKAGDTILIPERMTLPLPANVPFDSQRLDEILTGLKEKFPFITVQSIGQSVLGTPIHELRVGRGMKKVHMNGSFHANEWITTVLLLRLVHTYLLSLTNRVSISGINPWSCYQNIELSLVPMVNPDGVDLVINGPLVPYYDEVMKINGGSEEFVHWKANIRGVDLNKQFPANWDIDRKRKAPNGPAPRDYPGNAPLTEPEAIAMAHLAKINQFDYCLAFHTQGEEFYWGYEGNEPEDSARIAKRFEKVSGYKAVRYVDSHAGYKDWFLQEFQRPAFTIELGKGINPLPLSQFESIFTKIKGLFFEALSL